MSSKVIKAKNPLHFGKMKRNQVLMEELLQVMHGYQKNLTTWLEYPKWLKPLLSVGKKKEGLKSE